MISTSEFPFFVTLKSSKYGSPWCGGTILDEYNILTAAHCIARGRPPKYIKAGSVNRDGTDGYIIRIAKCTSHPKTKRTSMGCTKNDLQVCRLEKPIPLCKLLSIKKNKVNLLSASHAGHRATKTFPIKMGTKAEFEDYVRTQSAQSDLCQVIGSGSRDRKVSSFSICVYLLVNLMFSTKKPGKESLKAQCMTLLTNSARLLS